MALRDDVCLARRRRRNRVRSRHGSLARCSGHEWILLAALARFPFERRSWASPVMVALIAPRKTIGQRQRPHHTPAQLMCRLCE